MYLDEYKKIINASGNAALAEAAEKTAKNIWDKHLKNFTYNEHLAGLLFGNVQSGKTSHMFSILSNMADEGFKIFILLTTDNVYLQSQTYERALHDLSSFNICHEDDYIKFLNNKMSKPSVIVLKKNGRILRRWLLNLTSTGYCNGNPIVILDDEGDAASLNTLVNSNKKSAINKNLEAISRLSTASIYLQVTGTPQALLLQTQLSGWQPSFIYYFEPGEKYLGGNFFFSDNPMSNSIILTDEQEFTDLMQDDEFASNGLLEALFSFLLTTAHTFILNSKTVSNFVIHPSHKKDSHKTIAEKVGKYLNNMLLEIDDGIFESTYLDIYSKFSETIPHLVDYKSAIDFIENILKYSLISVKIMNSESEFTTFDDGINIVVGGNSLGRGITFPQLNTVYYSRASKNPQADTVWQHARMFGYDRNRDLIKIFMPKTLYKLFVSINNVNNALINQIQQGKNTIKMFYPSNLKPTRKQVIDINNFICIAGGTNYFPFYPSNISIEELDEILSNFDENVPYYSVDTRTIKNVLQLVGSDLADDWCTDKYVDFLSALSATEPGKQAILIVRRNRNISKGTGTLLSPTDRSIGAGFDSEIVLTMYKVTGERGWDGKQIWIPNIKFPQNFIFYDIEN